MPSERLPRPGEPEAVRTTIVGGRPPGSGKPVGPIPRGIEVLIKKAAVDAEFKRLLLEKRADAAREIGLKLDPAEALMLKAAAAAQLEAIIARTTVAPSILPAFLGRAAAVMLVALGAGAVGCDDLWPSGGIVKGRPPTKQTAVPTKPAPVQPPESKPAEPPPVTMPGIMPDKVEPAPKADAPKAETPNPDYSQQVMRGLQAIRPPEKPPAPDATTPPDDRPAQPPVSGKGGSRPDRPENGKDGTRD